MSAAAVASAAVPTGDARARLVDYFVEVAADVLPPSSRRASRHGAGECDDFERRVAFRLPPTDHADFPLPDGVPFFCIPSCLSAASPSAFERKPTFFSFSLTGGDGSRAYGFALHFYDSLAADAWRPRVFCLISHHPFFSLFKEVVSWVFRERTHTSEQRVVESILADASGQRSWFVSPTRRGIGPYRPPPVDTELSRAVSDTTAAATAASFGSGPGANSFYDEDLVDRVLSQFVLRAECPHPGGQLELAIDGKPFFSYHIHRGNVVHVDDYCFQVLFQCLSLKNVIYIVNCMLLEQRILIHSNHHGLLTPVCEALCALLFPFVWEHVYVPFLPVKLIEYLQAPVPYIMGLHTSSLATKIGADIFSSCVVVHIDKDKVVTPISSQIDDSPVDFVLARLPSLEVDALLRTVEHLVPQPVNGGGSIYTPSSHYSGGSGNNSPHANKSLSHPSSPLQHVVESLNFCNSRAPSENELEITFGEGPLGITFESTHMRMLAVNHFQPGRQAGTSAAVKTLPRLQNGLPGPAERSGLIRAGSFLVAINGVSTLDLTFEETIDRLRVEKRPVRLRFLNASAPHDSACRFAERLQSLSLVSALQIDYSNTLSRWVDSVRGAFAVLFTSIFRDFQRYILIEHTGALPSTSSSPSGSSKRATPLARSPSAHAHTSLRRRRSSALAFSVTFDHDSFCEASAESAAATATNSSVGFLREFTQTQSFMGFVNDSVMGRISHTTTYPQVELFHNCVHLYHEIGDPVVAAEAIALLFERDHTAIETLELELPQRDARAETVGVGSTLLSDAHALLSDASRSPIRSPVKSPLATGLSASSPSKRTSTTRQLEMIICGSLLDSIDPISKESIAASVEAALSASLDTELLTQLDDDPATPEISCAAQSPSSKSSTSSARTLTVGHRSGSLSSSGSVGSRSIVDDEALNQVPLQQSAGVNKTRQLCPEVSADDPLQS